MREMFAHNRFVVAVGCVLLLVTAVIAGAAGERVDATIERGEGFYYHGTAEHVSLWINLLVMIGGMIAGGVALLFPVQRKIGQAALATMIVCVVAMLFICRANADSLGRWHILRGTQSVTGG